MTTLFLSQKDDTRGSFSQVARSRLILELRMIKNDTTYFAMNWVQIFNFESWRVYPMKEEIKFEHSSVLSITPFSAAKELVKITKEVELDFNPTGKG